MKKSAGRILVVIPAYNESSHLGSVLDQVSRDLTCDVVVVNDNSTDNTQQVALDHGAAVLPLRLQLGAWGATQTGIRYGLQKGYDVIVTMDADGQHHSRDLSPLVDELQKEKADVVIGSYPDRGSPARHMAWWIFRKLSGINLVDLTSGLKVYGRDAACHLVKADATIFDYQDLGVLLYLLRNKMKIVEHDVLMSRRENDKSRIFDSWFLVGKYMIQTTLLCLSMRLFTRTPDILESH